MNETNVDIMKKRQVSTQIEEEEYKRMVYIRDETGIPISRQMNIKLKGYKIVKDE